MSGVRDFTKAIWKPIEIECKYGLKLRLGDHLFLVLSNEYTEHFPFLFVFKIAIIRAQKQHNIPEEYVRKNR
jgi:hypothetical protein